ncbi:hypothetical protein Y032_0004g1701 [Ancylostoma ceylanicum]|uniref:Uncharacterized protein n=1 Tax=Ancylostoma ceylanicum TaxID=53326 RepID=A0A016VTC4_9BILA|nr:hypothetical protein Y032_0004g1701 [Ancylostoma ceylanicum]
MGYDEAMIHSIVKWPNHGNMTRPVSDTQPPLAMQYNNHRPDSGRINPHRPDSSRMKILQTPATALCDAV